MENSVLLDTPKRTSLAARSANLRLDLKEWEKSFSTSHDGRKPSSDDIKADPEISKKYKDYQKVRDVLAGRGSAAVLNDPSLATTKEPTDQRPPKPRRSSFRVTRTEKEPSHTIDSRHHVLLEHPLLEAIGPTPQRDGRVLGLFESLGSYTPAETPSGKKRKLDALEPPPVPHLEKEMIPTSRRTVTPAKSPHSGRVNYHQDSETTNGKHSRTPTSNGKKSIMNQFLRTPVTSRYASMAASSGAQKPLMVSQTPLRDSILIATPKANEAVHQPQLDFTPPYLKRSYSFKERLLSVTTSTQSGDPPRPSTSHLSQRRLVRPLRRTASMPKPLSEIVQNLRQMEEGQHDDDLDALRELESGNFGVEVRSSHQTQANIEPNPDQENLPPVVLMVEPPAKVWKKKGQKRTTRKSTMRPATVQAAVAPKYVALEDEDTRADDTERDRMTKQGNEDDASENKSTSDQQPSTNSGVQLSKSKNQQRSQKAQTINPNAQAHMNFRSLKIRNKNSKAKGGGRFGGRFGQKRR